MTAPALALALLLAAGEAPSPAPEAAPGRGRLALDVPSALLWSGGLLLLAGAGAAWQDRLTPRACRWCEPPAVDRWARRELRWDPPGRAAAASDVLTVAVPAGSALALALLDWHAAGAREAGEDLLVVVEAVAAGTAASEAAKLVVARVRPTNWVTGGVTVNGRHSFPSGHAMLAFAGAAGATQVARLRGRPGWGWLGLATFAGAAATGWLQVAGDKHWLTDVLAGAALGTAAGLVVPPLVLRPAGGGRPAVALAPAPGGLALRF